MAQAWGGRCRAGFASGALVPCYSEASIADAYRRIRRVCAFAGVHGPDAEGIAQDIWLWLLRIRISSAKIATPWLEAVVKHFVLRRWRQVERCGSRERRWQQTMAERCEPDRYRSLERQELFRRMSEALPEKDRSVLALIRLGFTFAEATAALQIPRGSRDRIYRRLVSCGRDVIAA